MAPNYGICCPGVFCDASFGQCCSLLVGVLHDVAGNCMTKRALLNLPYPVPVMQNLFTASDQNTSEAKLRQTNGSQMGHESEVIRTYRALHYGLFMKGSVCLLFCQEYILQKPLKHLRVCRCRQGHCLRPLKPQGLRSHIFETPARRAKMLSHRAREFSVPCLLQPKRARAPDQNKNDEQPKLRKRPSKK